MSALSLGIDTSNYTTSVALVDENENMIYNKGILLEVKSGKEDFVNRMPFFSMFIICRYCFRIYPGAGKLRSSAIRNGPDHCLTLICRSFVRGHRWPIVWPGY